MLLLAAWLTLRRLCREQPATGPSLHAHKPVNVTSDDKSDRSVSGSWPGLPPCPHVPCPVAQLEHLLEHGLPSLAGPASRA